MPVINMLLTDDVAIFLYNALKSCATLLKVKYPNLVDGLTFTLTKWQSDR